MTSGIVLARRPVSAGPGPNEKYKQAVREAALRRFPDGPIVEGLLYVRITWFHRKPTTQDVDNIVKPILDALKGVVFKDDFRVSQCLATRIDLALDYTLSGNIRSETFDELMDLIDSGHDHVLCIEAGQMVSQQVVFGPIDGGVQ